MKIFFKIILFALILYFISMMTFSFFQEKFIFQNTKLNSDYTFTFAEKFDEIDLITQDNNKLNGILFKAKNSKGVLLYFHGNKGNLVKWGKIAAYFTKFNQDVFVIDYRSYGKSTGKFNEKKMYNDAQLCYDYLKEYYNEDQISIYGRSLGCTFAVKTAAFNHPKQLILEAPFYNLSDVVKYHYPLLPYSYLLRYKFNSNDYMPKLSCKTTIFHGTDDKVVPISSGQKLFDQSNKKLTSFIAIKKGTHHNLFDRAVYQENISMLFKNE